MTTVQHLNNMFDTIKPQVMQFDKNTAKEKIAEAKGQLVALQTLYDEVFKGKKTFASVKAFTLVNSPREGVAALIGKCDQLLRADPPAMESTHSSSVKTTPHSMTAAKVNQLRPLPRKVQQPASRFEQWKTFNEYFKEGKLNRLSYPTVRSPQVVSPAAVEENSSVPVLSEEITATTQPQVLENKAVTQVPLPTSVQEGLSLPVLNGIKLAVSQSEMPQPKTGVQVTPQVSPQEISAIRVGSEVMTAKSLSVPQSASAAPIQEAPPISVPTEIRIRCQVPVGHTLSIKGAGGGLRWEEKTPLEKRDEDLYAYCFEGNSKVQFKFCFDDQLESGEIRTISPGDILELKFDLFFPAVPVIIDFSGPSNIKLFIRGDGPGLSWDKGVELKQVGDKRVFETRSTFKSFEFRVLIGNRWEQGDNHKAEWGKTIQYRPRF